MSAAKHTPGPLDLRQSVQRLAFRLLNEAARTGACGRYARNDFQDGRADACDEVAKLLTAMLEETREADTAADALADALEGVKSALGDRLLGKGPLSKEYAHGVMDRINAALRAAGRLP